MARQSESLFVPFNFLFEGWLLAIGTDGHAKP